MAKLTTAGRNALPSKDFALPGGRFPIPDASHARNALARAAANTSPAQTTEIKRKVAAKFPGIHQGGKPQRHDHSLAMASATHLHKMGHISKSHHDTIHRKSKAAMQSPRFGQLGAQHYISTPTPVGPDEEGGM